MSAHKFVKATGAPSKCDVCGKTRNATAHRKATIAAEATTVAEAREDLLPEVDAQVDDAEIADALEAAGIEVAEEAADNNAAAAHEASEGQYGTEKAEPWGIPPVPDFVPPTEEELRDAMRKVADEIDPDTTVRLTDEEIAANKAAARAKLADDLAGLDTKLGEEKAKAKAKPAKAKPTTASIWVGWRITNEALKVDSSLSAKLKAAKPTGDLDRTVKLTETELRVLDNIAAKFMEPGHTGPEIYSGRALRGRIAAALAKIQ